MKDNKKFIGAFLLGETIVTFIGKGLSVENEFNYHEVFNESTRHSEKVPCNKDRSISISGVGKLNLDDCVCLVRALMKEIRKIKKERVGFYARKYLCR